MDWEEATLTNLPSNCLVCSAANPAHDKCDDEDSVGLSTLDKQLNVILILRDFLQVPSVKIQSFLRCVGDPSVWGVWICSKCNGSVRKAVKIHRKLIKVLEKLRASQEAIIKQIKSNCENATTSPKRARNEVGNKSSVTNQCRSFVQNYNYANFKNPFIAGDVLAREKLGHGQTANKKAPNRPDPAHKPQEDYLYIPTTSSVKVEVNEDEEDYYEPSQDDMLHSRFSSDEDEANANVYNSKVRSPIAMEVDSGNRRELDPVMDVDGGDDDDRSSSDKSVSDFDEQKISQGEGVYYRKTKSNFKCIKCGDLKTSIKDIISHHKLHKSSPYKCTSCPRVYSTNLSLRGHVKKYHPDVADRLPKLAKIPFRKSSSLCKLCGVRMPTRKFSAHKKLWHGPGSGPANIGTTGENLQGNADENNLPESDPVVLHNSQSCPTCKKTFEKVEELSSHLELHKTSEFHCHVCLQVFKAETKMNSHVYLSHSKYKSTRTIAKSKRRMEIPHSVTKAGKVRCSKCVRFFYSNELEAHEKLHETSPHNCYACGNVFTEEKALKGHLHKFHYRLFKEMRRVNKKAPLTVKLNPKDFPEDETDASSAGEEEEGPNKGRVACPLCKKYYFKPELSEKLCEHLERCPAARSGSTDDNDGHSHQELTLRCPICKAFNISLSSKMEFGEHVIVCHERNGDTNISPGNQTPLNQRLFECEVCPTKKYFQLEAFIEHYQDHSVKTIKCVECQKRYLNTTLLNWHYKNHTYITEIVPPNERYTKENVLPKLNWWCRMCNEKFSDEDKRDLHLRFKHPEESGERPYDCEFCQKGYACPDELKLHKGITHIRENLKVESVIPCDLCDEFCKAQKDLDQHKRKIHRVNLLVCEVCGVECATEINFKVHKQLHQEVRNHQCDECVESFTTAAYLRTHKFKVHTPFDKEINPLVCKYCDRAFSSAPSLRDHEAFQHTKKFKFFCELCGFGSMIQFKMTEHMVKKHGGGEAKTWTCPVEGCGKVYTSPANFKAHTNKHAGLAPTHPCEFCGKAFYRATSKWRHEQIHKNAETRPYTCEICGKSFPTSDYLYIHKRSHSRGNEFVT